MKVETSTINVSHLYNNRVKSGKKNDQQDKLRAQQNEMKLRESEDKLIKNYQERISDLLSKPMDEELRKTRITALQDKIQAIMDERAKREQEALQQELERQQAEMEKQKNENSKNSQPKPDETREEALRREDIKGLTEVSLSYDAINNNKRTRATLSAEAERLEQDIDNTYGPMQIGLDTTIRVKIGRSNPNDFNNTHLAKLKKGITGLTAALTSQVIELYKTVSNWTEQKAKILAEAPIEKLSEQENTDKTAAADKTNEANETNETKNDSQQDNAEAAAENAQEEQAAQRHVDIRL